MSEKEPEGEVMLRVLAMPADVNTAGDIFGGWVLSQMDIAGGIVAAERANGRVTTVAIDAMKFIRPVGVGDVLSVYGEVARVGNTSLAISLEAWVRRFHSETREKVTEGIFTFVALDADGKKRPVDS